MTAEHAAGVGGEVVDDWAAALALSHWLDSTWTTPCPHGGSYARDCTRCIHEMLYRSEWLAAERRATRQAAADAVLAEARAMCCDADTSAHHEATDGHARVMGIAERLAAAARGGQ